MRNKNRKCHFCDKNFIQKNRYLRIQKFCSRLCANRGRAKKARRLFLENNNQSCLQCNGKFVSQNKKQKFCSIDCRKQYTIKANTSTCIECKKEYVKKYKEQKYCSFLCHGINKFKIKKCLYCGKEFKVPNCVDKRSSMSGSFCSLYCVNSFRVGENNPNWHGGCSFEPYGTLFNRSFKKNILKKYSYRCILCGITKKLVVHHIDYNKQNNDIENLIVLCRSCHGRTNARRNEWQDIFIAIRHLLQG